MKSTAVLGVLIVLILGVGGYCYYDQVYLPKKARDHTIRLILERYGVQAALKADEYLRFYASIRKESYLLMWAVCEEIHPDNPVELLEAVERQTYEEVRNPRIRFVDICKLAALRERDAAAKEILEILEKQEQEQAIADAMEAEAARNAPQRYQYHDAEQIHREPLPGVSRGPIAAGYTYNPDGTDTAIPTTLDEHGRRVLITAPR